MKSSYKCIQDSTLWQHIITISFTMLGLRFILYFYIIFLQIGPNWITMSLTLAFISIGSGLVLIFICSEIHIACSIVELLILVMTLSSFLYTALSDPGTIVQQNCKLPIDIEDSNRISPNQSITCDICNIQRPPTASHCYACNVCIDGLDHHCAFIGKCIGKKTIRSFQIFITASVILRYYTTAIILYYVVIYIIHLYNRKNWICRKLLVKLLMLTYFRTLLFFNMKE